MVGTVTAGTTINVLAGVPIVVTPAAATANPVFDGASGLGVLGGDDGGEAGLTYTWSIVGTPPGPVTFSVNGTNAAKNTLATFAKAGDYDLLVTIADGTGGTATSPVRVWVRDAVAWYTADATDGGALADASGSNNTAKLFGISGSYGPAAGVRGGALQLAGGSGGGYASLPAGIVRGLGDFTVAAWVKPDAANSWARIFDFGNGPTSYMFLTARAGVAGNPLRFAISAGGIAGEQVVNGPPLAIGVWTHVAVTLTGNAATLYLNGRAYASNAGVTTHPADLGVTTNNFVGKSQFADPLFQGSIDDFRVYGKALTAADVLTLADVTAPQVGGGAFGFDLPQSVTLAFGEDVIASVDATDLSIVDLATGLRVPASQFVLAKQGGPGVATTATWTRGPAAGALPDGNYRATLPAGSVVDAAGNPLAADYALDFYVLAGDATRDRVVNFDDLLVLAKNYNKPGVGFAGGDFDGSGTVNFDDLLILAKSYNRTLAALPAPAALTMPPATATVVATKQEESIFRTTPIARPRALVKPRWTAKPAKR
jgi:hypothetical protein